MPRRIELELEPFAMPKQIKVFNAKLYERVHGIRWTIFDSNIPGAHTNTFSH